MKTFIEQITNNICHRGRSNNHTQAECKNTQTNKNLQVIRNKETGQEANFKCEIPEADLWTDDSSSFINILTAKTSKKCFKARVTLFDGNSYIEALIETRSDSNLLNSKY
jgi:hypothetical protein